MIRKLIILSYLSDRLTVTALNVSWIRPVPCHMPLAAMAEKAIDQVPVEVWRLIFDVLLVVDFRLPFLQPSASWSRRRHEFDEWARYAELLKNRGWLRLVSKRWNALVEVYPWRRLDLSEGFNGLPLEYHAQDVYWAVYPLGERFYSGDRIEALVQSASTIAVLSLTWHARSSLTKLNCLFAHASSFRRLQVLSIKLSSADRTSNDLATHIFFSHVNVFSSTLVSLRLDVNLYDSSWFESPPVLRLANLHNLDLCFRGLLGAFNISEWNCPKLTHLTLVGTIENTNYLTHLASIGSGLKFFSLRRSTGGKPFIDPNDYTLHFNDTFWKAFPLLEVLRFDGTSPWKSGLSDLPPSHPIRELIVQHNGDSPRYKRMVPLVQNFTTGNDTTERKRRVILEGVNWNDGDSASLKRGPMGTCASIAPWLEDEEGASFI